MRFLLVEDNSALAQSIAERLKIDGHAVDIASDIASAEACLSGAGYDLVLLDLMLPDGDGRTFLDQRHSRLGDTPVIVLTARSEVSDRVGALDLGADDYLTKPFDFAELEARCRAVLRRRGGSGSTVLRCGDLAFDPVAAVVTVAGEPRALRNRELRLLEAFMRARGRVLSKDHLHDRLFSYDDEVSDNAIEVYVGRLRRRIAGSTARIETIRGVGYRLDADEP
ncbi:MAG: DNA-binding response regulator [Alphaproteobacteria bacterium]|nr:MAG: DNA-binding response regulator [Alphaproteobacteria bacterium]